MNSEAIFFYFSEDVFCDETESVVLFDVIDVLGRKKNTKRLHPELSTTSVVFCVYSVIKI